MIARRVLGICSWTAVGVIAVAVLGLLIEPLGAALRSDPGTFGYVLVKVLTGLMAASLLLAWGAAFYDVATTSPWNLGPPRWVLIALLIVGHMVTAVLYYFLAVYWKRTPAVAPAAPGHGKP